MSRPVVEKLKEKPMIDGPLSQYRGNFRSRLAESILSGRLQSELIVDTFKSLGRSMSYSIIDASVKPFVEKRVKRRIEKWDPQSKEITLIYQ